MFFASLSFSLSAPSTLTLLRRGVRWLAATLLIGALCACGQKTPWQLIDIKGHFPDLKFALTSDDNRPATAAMLKGNIVLLYFGYTFCPDVCPDTLARLTQAIQQLGPLGRHVRIAFITVDPHRDTPAVLHAYVKAFDAEHAFGFTGTPQQIESLARRYRVAYRLEKPRPDGSYDVTHSAAVYIFDQTGHARLMAPGNTPVAAFVHDLKILVTLPT
jgi:protein SCO1/2